MKDVAAAIGVSPGMINKYKAGAAPGANVLAAASVHYGVSTDFLIGVVRSDPGQALRDVTDQNSVEDLLQRVDDLLENAAAIKRAALRLKKK